MENLWTTSESLNNCRYLPDIDIKTLKQRSKARLPPNYLVWPNLGDQLVSLPETAGLHFPFAYVAGDEFGAIFNCHREDFDLHSINFLYTGRKSWIVISPSHCIALEEKFRATQDYFPSPCSQPIRHNQVSFTREQLEEWNIPYNVVDQQAGQFVITFPRAYHQGFSPASSIAGAVTYAGENWSYTDYQPCNGAPCPNDAITIDGVQPQFSAILVVPQGE